MKTNLKRVILVLLPILLVFMMILQGPDIQAFALSQLLDDDIGQSNITYVTPESFGAIGDGKTDDTKAFKELLEYTKLNDCIVLLTGDYAVNSINLPDGTHIISEGGTLRKIPHNETSYSIITLNENCLIDGLILIGDREHNSTDGQWGSCAFIAGKNSVIKNCIMYDPHGDGIYIHADNAVVDHCIINNAFRNGISVTDGDNFIIRDTSIFNVSGHNPQCGIDIEPNNATDSVSGQILDVSIVDCSGGILIYKNSSQINTIQVECQNIDIFGIHGKNAIRVRNDVFSSDKYIFENIRVLWPQQDSDSVMEFVFSGDDNPIINMTASIIGGENKQGVVISSETTHCSNPINLKIVSKGWHREKSPLGYEFLIKMKNPQANICTNLEVNDIYQKARIVNPSDALRNIGSLQ